MESMLRHEKVKELTEAKSTIGSSSKKYRDGPSQSKIHFFVQNMQTLPLHYLVPLSSERRVQQHPDTPLTSDTGRTSKSGLYEPNFIFPSIYSASSFESTEDEFPGVTILEHSNYSESISFGIIPKTTKSRCLSVCYSQVDIRRKENVGFGPGLSPVKHQNKIIVYTNSTRKKYQHVVHCKPTIKPMRYSSTCFIRPKYTAKAFVSLLEYNGIPHSRWYHCSVELRPNTFSCSKLHCFELNNNNYDSDGEDVKLQNSNGFPVEDITVPLDSPYVVNSRVWDYSATTADTLFGHSVKDITNRAECVFSATMLNESNKGNFVNGQNDALLNFNDVGIISSVPKDYNECLDNAIIDNGTDDLLVHFINDDSMAKHDGDLFKGYNAFSYLNGNGGSKSSLDEVNL